VLASPIFNILPFQRHVRAGAGEPRDLLIAILTLQDLSITRSEQRNTPLGDGRVNYASGNFSADIHYEEDGLFRIYEDYLERL
jgi:hypothetical protein